MERVRDKAMAFLLDTQVFHSVGLTGWQGGDAGPQVATLTSSRTETRPI
jgi:hypothetical protein